MCLDGSTMLSSTWSLLNMRDPQSPWFPAPSPPRVKSGTAALLSRFSQECSISYPIFSIDILANTMCREFLACFFVTNLNIGIKHLCFYYLTALYMTSYEPKLSLKLFYLILLPQGCTKSCFNTGAHICRWAKIAISNIICNYEDSPYWTRV